MCPFPEALPLLLAMRVARRTSIKIQSEPGSCHQQSPSRRPLRARPGNRPQTGEGPRHLHLRLGERSKGAREGGQARPCYRDRSRRPGRVLPRRERHRRSWHDQAASDHYPGMIGLLEIRDIGLYKIAATGHARFCTRPSSTISASASARRAAAGRSAYTIDSINAPSSGCTTTSPTLPSTHSTSLLSRNP